MYLGPCIHQAAFGVLGVSFGELSETDGMFTDNLGEIAFVAEGHDMGLNFVVGLHSLQKKRAPAKFFCERQYEQFNLIFFN